MTIDYDYYVNVARLMQYIGLSRPTRKLDIPIITVTTELWSMITWI